MSASLLLFQEASGPSGTAWLVILSTVAAGTAGVFAAFLAASKKTNETIDAARVSAEKRRDDDVSACEKRERERVEKAEVREDSALERLSQSTALVSGMAGAITDFGGVLKDAVAEIRRTAERSDSSVREIAELKREAATLREVTLRETSELKREIVDMRRDTAEIATYIRLARSAQSPPGV